jgi:hypothetical protein
VQAKWLLHNFSASKENFMQRDSDTLDFVHPELGREITAIGGHYVFVKEICLPFRDREILYFVGYAVLDSTCCGVGGCAYVLVAGFITQWKYKADQNAAGLSQVEPIRDEMIQKEVRALIRQKEMVYQVTFN